MRRVMVPADGDPMLGALQDNGGSPVIGAVQAAANPVSPLSVQLQGQNAGQNMGWLIVWVVGLVGAAVAVALRNQQHNT